MILPTPRWYPLRPHDGQRALWTGRARFKVAACGRRSGKSELAKRKGVALACSPQKYIDAHYVFGAPTYQQAKRIFWPDIKKLVPRDFFAGRDPRRATSEGELTIRLITGAEIIVTGLDVPERIEGIPIDWAGIDEIGNTKASAWTEHIRPALSERQGEAWLFGVPEGRNHYYELAVKAQEIEQTDPELWSFHCWPSADILPPEEIAIAKAELDALTFAQEYEASFICPTGRVYYPFNRQTHCSPVKYYPNLPLIFCFDFNVSPGIAVIAQEQAHDLPGVAPTVTACIGEVWIDRDSNTKRVCDELLRVYGNHKGPVYCYGDATGGSKGTAKVEGSDWELIRGFLSPAYGKELRIVVPSANPRERVRVNAMNSRLQSADGVIHLLLNDKTCPHLVMDLEGVSWKKDGSGDIDKSSDSKLTHLSDALGYYVAHKFPLFEHRTSIAPWE